MIEAVFKQNIEEVDTAIKLPGICQADKGIHAERKGHRIHILEVGCVGLCV